MNKQNKLTLFFSLIIFTLIFSFGVFAQNVEVIKYGAETPAPVFEASNVFINKYASDYSFLIGAVDKNPEVCICSTEYDKIYITNTAPYEATFTIITNLPETVNTPYNNLKILSGQTAEISLLVSADCNSAQDVLDYNILVSNNFGTQYTIERELQINRCQSIEATLYASQNKISPCESVDYIVELKNPASFTEQYVISPKSSQYFDNAKYEVTLGAGKKTHLNFTYSPECSVYGEKNIVFNIESVNNKLTAKLDHDLIIEKAYDFEVLSPESVDLCRDDSKVIPITVKNLAGFDNEFFLTLVNKQDFLNSNSYYANLSSGEEKEFLITAKPTSSTKTEQILDFEIKTKLGDMVYRGSVALYTNDCYELSLNIISDNNPELCSGTYTYDVVVENKGNFKERLILSANSDYAEVFPSTLILDPSENQTVVLSMSLPDEKRTIPFRITATLDNGKVWEDTINVKIEKKNDCTFAKFNKQKLFARYGTDNVSFSITNAGSTSATYDISYEGTEWIILETSDVTLKPRETADIKLSLYSDDSEVLKKYNFKINATADNGEVYENNMVLKMTDTPLLQKLYNKATTNTCTSVSSILILLLALGVVAVILLSWKRVRVPLAFKLIALGLIVLVIIAVLVFQGFPESRYPAIDKTTVNNLNVVWYEDSTQELELNNYFYDPDNDTLIFTVDSEPENISVKIEGSEAKLTPNKDWFGTARIRFAATDNYGGEITSQRINLEVVEVPEFSYVGCYMKNCVYINAILLILFLALIFLLRTRREKDKVSRKVAFVGVKKQKGFLYFLDKDGDVSRVPMARNDKKNQKFKKEKVGKTVATKKRK